MKDFEQIKEQPPVNDTIIPELGMFHESSTNFDRKGNDPISPSYNRGLKEYEDLLSTNDARFRIKDWKHKRLLDIGSGGYDRFGMEARAKGVDVVSLNPALKSQRERDTLSSGVDQYNSERVKRLGLFGVFAKDKETKSVAGLGQSLPFKDDSFDCVTSVYAVPHYLHHLDEGSVEYTRNTRTREADKVLIRQAFNELLRVLKPGGKAYLRDMHAPPRGYLMGGFCQSDGTEVIEILSDLEQLGIQSIVYEKDDTDRLIIINKPL